MEREIMYVAPEAQVLSAQVEKGVFASGGGDPDINPPGGGRPGW